MRPSISDLFLSGLLLMRLHYVRGVIERNRQAGMFTCTNVSSRVVRWDSERDVAAMEGRFDVVMCADCLFLDQYRACLVDALRRLLRPDGTALVFAPTRGDTLTEFCRLAERAGLLGTALVFAPTRGDTLTEFCRLAERAGLLVCRYDNYDSIIWDLHIKMKREGKEAYDENIHYPVLLTLTHIPSPHLL
ncbi:calmodulin-lysine N-methyltransferase [Silurus asotus]|uniref:Calmodulin-lysine N-methyltransferase n=1 Tax=Silurus asotus TaxID=30991 RepID=A0AAD5A0B2_SILAS|nr:calmodulin-lysine N-methyltransferase [Silurus asotus]